jgi:hypothetical protein
VLVTADLDDESMNCPEIWGFLNDRKDRVTVRWGERQGKIAAVNDGLAEAEWDLLIVGSDDMAVMRHDYASYIAALFTLNFPDGDGVLHLNDGRVGKILNTLPIMDRKFFLRFGYVYSPQYCSLWADNELTDVSRQLGRAVYVDQVIIKHDWIGSSAPDSLHRQNESHYAADARTYRERKKAGFPRG